MLQQFKESSLNVFTSFLYHLYRKDLISIDSIIQRISINIKINGRSIIRISENSIITKMHKASFALIWFYPELLERNLLDDKLVNAIESGFSGFYSDVNDIEKMKEMRDSYSEKDSIIQSIRNDDVDTLQSIVSIGGIDIQNKKIELPFIENLNGEISFVDYAAAYGSVKCFKYLMLNDASITYNTFICSVEGGNVEIIRIVYQNRSNFGNFLKHRTYVFATSLNSNPKMDVFKSAIKKHEYQILDWLLDQNPFESEMDLIFLIKYSIECGNAHSMLEIIRKLSNLNNLRSQDIYKIVEDTCSGGFYKILKLLLNLIHIHDLADPTKGEHSDLKDISNRRLKIRLLNSDLLKSSVRFGMLSIFELIFNETEIKNSQCLFEALIEAVRSNSLDIVKYILENKIYELSPLYLIKAIQQSIQFNSVDVTNYFFQKEITVTTEILESACHSQNFELVKQLIQKANEKQISIDFTKPFIKAVNLFSDQICRYLIEKKVSLNYQEIFQSFDSICDINPKTIIFLIENADEEIKDDVINQSIKTAISSRRPELFEYLFKKDINLNDLLLQAIEKSDFQTTQTILNYNHSPEFVNQIGPSGTPLHVAVNSHKNDVVELLLKIPGIDPSISNGSNKTPLVLAVEMYNFKAVEMILDFYGDSIKDQGYQIHAALEQVLFNQSKRTKEKNDRAIDNRFILFPAQFNLQNERVIFEKLLACKKKLNPIYMVEKDLLSYAIIENDIDLFNQMLEMTDLKQKLSDGNSYLHFAIDSKREITEIQKALINHPDIDINASNISSETVLIKAVKTGNIELIDLILNHPKFDPKLSQLDYAFFLSIRSKALSRNLLKAKSLDVNYHSAINSDMKLQTTPLIEAIRVNDIELVDLIINHHSFNPSKSKIKSCLFNSVNSKNLNLFKFLLKISGTDINSKDNTNKSLLGCAASIQNNELILTEILNNENFDPVKSDIQTSFLESNSLKAIKMLVAYDEKHGNFLSLDKIDLLIQSKYDPIKRKIRDHQKPNKAHQYLLRKSGIIPRILPICTSIVTKQKCEFDDIYECKTCNLACICRACCRICHKGHEIKKMRYNTPIKRYCSCSLEKNYCKFMANQVFSYEDEIYECSLNNETLPNGHIGYGNLRIADRRYESDNDNYDYDSDDEFTLDIMDGNLRIDSLRCTLDLSGYQPFLQTMYYCHKCQVNVCQNCAIRCHRNHTLKSRGMVPDSICHCKDVADCKCTDRKTVICSYLFYGTEYIVQPWFTCSSCVDGGNKGLCSVCAKNCHDGHLVRTKGDVNAFCDCGANDLKSICRCMKLPPFNHLTCCTNLNQNYVVQEQRLYHCLTCGITSKNQGICESCAIHCHVGHKVVFVGICSFACECATVNLYERYLNCTASLCPEMNRSGSCTRSFNNGKAVFGKYTCYTCDKDGKVQFCDSCAVNCHKNHDVHFVEYSNFECQCDHCKCIEVEKPKRIENK